MKKTVERHIRNGNAGKDRQDERKVKEYKGQDGEVERGDKRKTKSIKRKMKRIRQKNDRGRQEKMEKVQRSKEEDGEETKRMM